MTHIPVEIQRFVYGEAQGRCEYCLLHERYAMKPHEFDHILAEKHGGQTIKINICLSCLSCNRHKGSDLCSVDTLTGDIATLFNPRQQLWADHFQLTNGIIQPLTPQGRVTARLLQFNNPKLVRERIRLSRLGRYP